MAKWVCSVCGYVYEGDSSSGMSVQYARLRLRNLRNRMMK